MSVSETVEPEAGGPRTGLPAPAHHRDLHQHRGDRLRDHRGGHGDARGGPGPGRSDLLRLVVLGVPDRHALRHRGGRSAERPDRAGQAPAGRDGDLRRRPAAGRVRAAHGPAGRWPAGAGTGQRPDEHRDLRAGRPGLLAHPATAGVHLHLHCLDPAVVRRAARLGLADRAAELALGVLRSGADGGRRRAAGAAHAAPDDVHLGTGRLRPGRTQAGSAVGRGCGGAGRRRPAAGRTAAGLGRAGPAGRRPGRAGAGTAPADAGLFRPVRTRPARRHRRPGTAGRAPSSAARRSCR